MTIKAIETEYNGYKFRSRLEARWAVFFDALGVEYEYEPEGFMLDSGWYLPDFRVKCYGKRGEINLPPKDTDWHGCRYCKFGGDDYDHQCNCRNKNAEFDEHGMVSVETDDGVCMNCDWFVPENDGYPFDLYIEVKPAAKMTQYDANRIIEFSNMAWDENGAWINEKENETNPILVVGNIPKRGCSSDSYAVGSYEKMNGINIHPFNYELIDGDDFAAYPAARNGKFYLWGDDSNYINTCDIDRVEAAYDAARQARFEHGETPVIHHE